MNRKLFGTDGIRGKANIYPMTGEVAFLLGRAVTFYFQKINSLKTKRKNPLIIIGKDTRLSCYMLEQAFSAGVCAQGGKAVLTGPFPTPGVAFVTDSMRADAGVMISASHNTFYDNGIKIFNHDGNKLPDSVELELEKLIFNPELMEVKVEDQLGRAQRLDEVIGRYIVHAKSAYTLDSTLDGMRIVVDCANGAGYKIAPMILEELGAEVIKLGVSPNGVNINLNCGALHPGECSKAVLNYRADLGICLDGDADRVIMIDEKGEVIHGDVLIGLLSKYLSHRNQLGGVSHVVGTQMTNSGLENYLESLSIDFSRAKVGDRYISEKMKETGAVFGGEPSGHLIFKDHSTTGDGILAALKVLECVNYYSKSLHSLSKEVILYPQLLENVSVKEKKPLEKLSQVQSAIEKVEEKLSGKGRVLVRYSGTESIVRVMVEGENKTKLQKYADEIVKAFKSELG